MIKVALSMGKIKCFVANINVPKMLQSPHCFLLSIQATEREIWICAHSWHFLAVFWKNSKLLCSVRLKHELLKIIREIKWNKNKQTLILSPEFLSLPLNAAVIGDLCQTSSRWSTQSSSLMFSNTAVFSVADKKCHFFVFVFFSWRV